MITSPTGWQYRVPSGDRKLRAHPSGRDNGEGRTKSDPRSVVPIMPLRKCELYRLFSEIA